MTESPSKKQRKWKPKESEMMLSLVKENYAFLSESLHPGKTKAMINAKWQSITDDVNALGAHPVPLTATQVKKKWSDTKSTTKKKCTALKRSRQKTGGGKPEDIELTASEQIVQSILPTVAINGIPNTDLCDTVAPS